MSQFVFGIDTSNYKTSCATFFPESGEVHNFGEFLSVEFGGLGLRQSDALFQHIKNLPQIMEKLPMGGEIVAVGYSSTPRSVEGSYMPCFLAGETVGRSVAAAACVPAYSFSHQHGHLMSALYSAQALNLAKSPFLAWHLSGGTTELLLVSPNENSIFLVEILGGTIDISAGQVIDRCGVALGTAFPSGVHVERLALESSCTHGYAVKHNEYSFSLSGMENQFKKSIADGTAFTDICAMVLNGICKLIFEVTKKAITQYKLPVVFSGGVANSVFLQRCFNDKNIIFAQNGLGGDNAVGTALLAAFKEGVLCL